MDNSGDSQPRPTPWTRCLLLMPRGAGVCGSSFLWPWSHRDLSRRRHRYEYTVVRPKSSCWRLGLFSNCQHLIRGATSTRHAWDRLSTSNKNQLLSSYQSPCPLFGINCMSINEPMRDCTGNNCLGLGKPACSTSLAIIAWSRISWRRLMQRVTRQPTPSLRAPNSVFIPPLSPSDQYLHDLLKSIRQQVSLTFNQPWGSTTLQPSSLLHKTVSQSSSKYFATKSFLFHLHLAAFLSVPMRTNTITTTVSVILHVKWIGY